MSRHLACTPSRVVVWGLGWGIIWLAIASCSSNRPPPAGVRRRPPVAATCAVGRDGIICVGDIETTCDATGRATKVRDCVATNQRCAPTRGCVTCIPGEARCDGETPYVCNPDGRTETMQTTCDPAAGQHCSKNGCDDLCRVAAQERSYIGCEYVAVPVINHLLDPLFTFAVVAANPQLVTAHVTVDLAGGEGGDERVAEQDIAPGQLAVIALSRISALQDPAHSVELEHAAYVMRSDVPVAAYQFNALEYQVDHRCTGGDDPNSGGRALCHSYTNDASLLIPTTVLGTNYVTVARPTNELVVQGRESASPGFLTIAAVDDEPVKVDMVLRSHVAALDGHTYAPGDMLSVMLGRGDVLQLVSAKPPTCDGSETDAEGQIRYCNPDRDYDLTGTEIRSSGRVAVFAGHACTFVPFNRWACDHLEEQMLPVETWGQDVVVAPTKQLRREPNVVRIVSAQNGNHVELEPADAHPPVDLDRGDFFELETTVPLRIRSTAAMQVAQFIVGQDYGGYGAAGPGASGDPAMALLSPAEQFRDSYTFLSPLTYVNSYVTIVAPSAADVAIDGQIVRGFTAIGDTGLRTVGIEIDPGAHRIDATQGVGILVYGFGTYTSYLYPGGLDLRFIAPPI